MFRDVESDVPAEWHTSDTTPEWEKLVNAVTRAAARHSQNPEYPLVEIGRFEAIGTRGVGGFGVVFEVRDPELDRHVAVKVCLASGPAAERTLRREARLLAKLSHHPNIVTVHDFCLIDGLAFIVMEFVDGCTVQEYASQRSRPPWTETIDIFLAAGRGLAAAHAAKIIHGDFKPANVLLDAGDPQRPRVADFGFGKIMIEQAPDAEREALGCRGGTPGYTAPEVLLGKPCDARSDQFSFSVSAWQALDGHLPFEGRGSAEFLDYIEHHEPRVFNRKVPARVRAVFRRGLAKEPSERYPDMPTLLADLARARQPRLGWARDRSPWLTVGLAAWFVGSTVLGGLGWLDRRAELTEPLQASEPIELRYPHNLTSPCAMGDEQVSIDDEELLEICTQIRNGHLKSADTGWENARNERLSGDRAALIEATLIVAHTFVDHAIAIQHAGPEDAVTAARRGKHWAGEAGLLIDPHEGLNDSRVSPILTRVKPLLPP